MKPTGTIRDIRIGTKIKFVPAEIALSRDFPGAKLIKASRVLGIIDYVNLPHRFFRVRYEIHGKLLHQSFKF